MAREPGDGKQRARAISACDRREMELANEQFEATVGLVNFIARAGIARAVRELPEGHMLILGSLVDIGYLRVLELRRKLSHEQEGEAQTPN